MINELYKRLRERGYKPEDAYPEEDIPKGSPFSKGDKVVFRLKTKDKTRRKVIADIQREIDEPEFTRDERAWYLERNEQLISSDGKEGVVLYVDEGGEGFSYGVKFSDSGYKIYGIDLEHLTKVE